MTPQQLSRTNSPQITVALKNSDKSLAELIDQIGDCLLEHGDQGFPALARSIISQQLSKASAQSIHKKLLVFFNSESLSPPLFRNASEFELRSAGLSQSKIQYLKGLADHVLEGNLDFEKLENMPDEEVIETLTQIRGIGRWTAEMYLIFSMNRLDVFPIGDGAIRRAMSEVYDIPKEQFDDQARAIAEQWKPYRTIACWYLYRHLDQSRVNKKTE